MNLRPELIHLVARNHNTLGLALLFLSAVVVEVLTPLPRALAHRIRRAVGASVERAAAEARAHRRKIVAAAVASAGPVRARLLDGAGEPAAVGGPALVAQAALEAGVGLASLAPIFARAVGSFGRAVALVLVVAFGVGLVRLLGRGLGRLRLRLALARRDEEH